VPKNATGKVWVHAWVAVGGLPHSRGASFPWLVVGNFTPCRPSPLSRCPHARSSSHGGSPYHVWVCQDKTRSVSERMAEGARFFGELAARAKAPEAPPGDPPGFRDVAHRFPSSNEMELLSGLQGRLRGSVEVSQVGCGPGDRGRTRWWWCTPCQWWPLTWERLLLV
jgi:hypothetical protein